MNDTFKIIQADCGQWLKKNKDKNIHCAFVDPPFNQGKDYRFFDDDLPDEKYWEWITHVLSLLCKATADGGAVYFMQREKNTEFVLTSLREAGWTFQNLIIWKKKTSAVPCANKYGKHYQIIAFATKGERARVFNRLRISPPLPATYKLERENGVYVTDVWDDIRELTSGYFAGDEAIREPNGERFHKQQTPVALLLRILLSSTMPGDTVFDPFAGTGTTLVAAHQLKRKSVGIEIDPENVKCIETRLKNLRDADDIEKYYKDYTCTENIDGIWDTSMKIEISQKKSKQFSLFAK